MMTFENNVEKEKMLVTRILPFPQNVFHCTKDSLHDFNQVLFGMCIYALNLDKFKSFWCSKGFSTNHIVCLLINPFPNTPFWDRPKFKEATDKNWNVANTGFQNTDCIEKIVVKCEIAIDGSARSIDPSLAQASIDRSCCAIDGWSCTIDHLWPSIDACTVRHEDDWTEAEWLRFGWLALFNVSIYV